MVYIAHLLQGSSVPKTIVVSIKQVSSYESQLYNFDADRLVTQQHIYSIAANFHSHSQQYYCKTNIIKLACLNTSLGRIKTFKKSIQKETVSIASKSCVKQRIALLKEKKNRLLVKAPLSKKDRISVSCLTAQIWSLETTLRK